MTSPGLRLFLWLCLAAPLVSSNKAPNLKPAVSYESLNPWVLNVTIGKIMPLLAPSIPSKEAGLFFASPFNRFPQLNDMDPINAVYRIRREYMFSDQPPLEMIARDISFPNYLLRSPKDFRSIFDKRDRSIVVATGRFPIGPSVGEPGGILICSVDRPNVSANRIVVFPETADASGKQWYFNDMFLYDVNQDGKTDILTVRKTARGPPCFPPNNCCNPPYFAPAGQCFDYPYFPFAGQVVWFEQPADPQVARVGNWPMHILTNPALTANVAPDTQFDFKDIDQDGVPEMVGVNFWGKNVYLLWTTTGLWSDPSSIVQVTVNADKTLGNFYDVRFVDVNADGAMDILATNHVPITATATPAATLLAYEIPRNFKTSTPLPGPGSFSQHILDTNFPTRYGSNNLLAPGDIRPITPRLPGPSASSVKPGIFLSGDGSGSWYLYRPVSSDPADWSFDRTTLDSDLGDFIEPAFEEENPTSLLSVQTAYCGCLQRGTMYRGVLVTFVVPV